MKLSRRQLSFLIENMLNEQLPPARSSGGPKDIYGKGGAPYEFEDLDYYDPSIKNMTPGENIEFNKHLERYKKAIASGLKDEKENMFSRKTRSRSNNLDSSSNTKEVNRILKETMDALRIPSDASNDVNAIRSIIVRSYYSQSSDAMEFEIRIEIDEDKLEGVDHNFNLDRVVEPRNDIKQKINGIIKGAEITNVDKLTSDKYDDMVGLRPEFRMLVGAIIIQGKGAKLNSTSQQNMKVYNDLDRQLYTERYYGENAFMN